MKVTLTQADALAAGWEAKQFLTLPPAQGGVSLLPGGVSDWLAALRLAEGVPFQYLVADDRLLPPESIRFFYLDRNWTDALVAGALSVGAITTDDQAQLQVLYLQIRDELDADERLVRVPGNEVAVSGPADVVTGLLIRSRAVSGWPGMHVRAYRDEVPDDGSDDDPSRLHLMRLERLAPAVLLALFDGVPAVVHIEEPRSGLQFGFELTDPQPQGAIAYDLPLRAPGTGTETGATVAVPFRPNAPGVVEPSRPAAAGPGPGRGHRKRRRVRARGPPVPLPPGVRPQPGRSRPGLLRPVPAGRRHHRDADLAGVRGGQRQRGRRRRWVGRDRDGRDRGDRTVTSVKPGDVLTAQFSTLARAGVAAASVATWDPQLLRPPRVLVPMDVQALSIPAGDAEPDAQVLGQLPDPVPDQSDSAPGMPKIPPFTDGDPRAAGVYLHWAAVNGLAAARASRPGEAAPVAGGVASLPLADRWLVVRVARRDPAAHPRVGGGGRARAHGQPGLLAGGSAGRTGRPDAGFPVGAADRDGRRRPGLGRGVRRRPGPFRDVRPAR